MPSVYLTEDHEIFRRTVRRFMEEEIAPHTEEWEKAREIPRSAWLKMGELGFLGISHPEEYGGAEADIFYDVVFLEELARSMMGGFCASVSVQEYMATAHIKKVGTEEQKRRYLGGSITGELVGALAVTEPDTGSDVAAIRTSAVKDGDFYVINGAKTFITNGAGADFVTLACKTNKEAGSAGISLIIVDKDTPGFTVTRKLDKMGLHSSDTAELSFEDARVPALNLIGQENQGFYYMMDCFQTERLVGGLLGAGAAQLCLEITRRYVSERQAFGRPIGRFQVIRHKLAQLATELEAARQLCYHTAWLHGQGRTAIRESSMAKLYASELSKRMADECLQFFGGFGYMEEYPISRMYRDARVGTIVAGTSEIMLEIISRIMLEEDQVPTGTRPAPKKPGTPENSAPEATDAEPPTVAELFASLKGRFRADKAPQGGAVVQFIIEGAEKAKWTVKVAGDGCDVAEGLFGSPDCLVEMDEATFVGVETGRRNAQSAFMSGGIKVSNLSVMMQYLGLFKPFGGR